METRSSGGDEGDDASHRLQRALLDRARAKIWWGASGCGEPRISSPSPHLLFIALRDRGPSASRKAERPRSGRGSKAQLAVGGDQPNTSLLVPVELCLASLHVRFQRLL